MIKDEKLIINYSTNVNFIKFLAAIMVILAHAFPIQQFVAYYCKGSTPYENILLTIPMSILCGICVCALSGRFCGIIEKQFKQ